MHYQFELPNTRAKTYSLVTLLVLLINLLMFGLAFVRTSDQSAARSRLLFGLVFGIFALLFHLLRNKVHFFQSFRSEIAFIIMSLLWLTMGADLPAICVLAVAVMGFFTWKKPVVQITDEQIIYPSFPAKKISWGEVSNLMLKDGLLTIDLRSNQLIQSEIIPGRATINEQEFNRDCAAKIQSEPASV